MPDDPRDPDGARKPGELREHEYAGDPREDGDSPAPSRPQQGWHDSFNPEVLEKALRRSGGVHPDDVITQLRYAPLALTHLCWRNTVVEDWHADPNSSLHDGEMMAANVATTRIFHQALWVAFGERVADAALVGRDDFAPEDLESLQYAFADAYEAGFDPDRRLPHGRTLADVGGDTVDDLTQHAELQLDSLLDQAKRHGVAVVILWRAARGHGACRDWWGSPGGPASSTRFSLASMIAVTSTGSGGAGAIRRPKFRTRRGSGTCCCPHRTSSRLRRCSSASIARESASSGWTTHVAAVGCELADSAQHAIIGHVLRAHHG